jgi:hypothetical protein
MKHVALVLFVLALSLANVATAQIASAGNNMNASVGVELTVAAADEGDFTELAPGITYTVSPAGTKVPGGPGNGGAFEDVQPVTFTIDGQGAGAVAVTFLLTDRMIGDAGGLIQVGYTSQSAGWNVADDYTAAMTLFDPRVGTTLYLDDNGHAYVSLGAVLTVPLGALPGAYIGTVGLSASYTGF